MLKLTRHLFIPSELAWKEKGVRIKQETAFPESENVSLTITTDKPVKMPVYLRYPSWSDNVEVKVNGKKIGIRKTPSEYITVDMTWKNGDKIEVSYPISLYLAEANDNPDKAAIMYEPLVLAGVMETEGMKSPAPFSNPELYNDYYTYEYNVPETITTSLLSDKSNLSGNIKPVTGQKLAFTTKENIRLEPIHRIHHQRYVVYLDFKEMKQMF